MFVYSVNLIGVIMSKVNKIIQYGLQEDVYKLRKKGYTQNATAKFLSNKYKIELSAMSINRFLKSIGNKSYNITLPKDKTITITITMK